MSAYGNDARVRKVNDHLFTVYGDDKYAAEEDTPGCWFVYPTLDSAAGREAQRLSRPERDEWASQTTVGPFPSEDAAIESLIGPPR